MSAPSLLLAAAPCGVWFRRCPTPLFETELLLLVLGLVDAEAAPPSHQNAADGRAGVGGVAGAMIVDAVGDDDEEKPEEPNEEEDPAEDNNSGHEEDENKADDDEEN